MKLTLQKEITKYSSLDWRGSSIVQAHKSWILNLELRIIYNFIHISAELK